MSFMIDGERDGLVAWPDDPAAPSEGWWSFLDACGPVAEHAGATVRVPGWAVPATVWWFETADAAIYPPRISAAGQRRINQAEVVADNLDAIPTDDRPGSWPVTVPGPDGPVTFAEPADFGFMRPLRDFQADHVARILHGDGLAIFSVPGAGKTTVALACLGAWRAAGTVARTVVVAPLSAWEAWEHEPRVCFDPDSVPAVTFGRGAIGEVVVVNYEVLQDRHETARLVDWLSEAPSLVIFDEAHRAKAGRDGRRGRGCLDLAGASDRRLVLTGTPAPNSPGDLASMFDLGWPGRGSAMVGHPHRSRLFVRATKSDLGLDPVCSTIERVPLSSAHRRLYDAAIDTAAAALADPAAAANLERVGRIMMLLLQLPTNPAAVLDRSSPLRMVGETTHARLEDLASAAAAEVVPAKFVRVRQLVEAGTKTLVWSNFTHHIAELTRLLSDLEPAVVTGTVPRRDPAAATDREREITRFRTDPSCRVLLATPQTLGEGISLHQVCQSQIWVDRTFNAGVYLQALDRTHRLGMPTGTQATVTVLAAADTVDEVVETRLAGKVARMGALLDDRDLVALSLPDVEETLDIVDLFLDGGSGEDLAALFAHLHVSLPPRPGIALRA